VSALPAPPKHIELLPSDMPHWWSLVAERAEWSAHELELLAGLARTLAQFEREQRLCASEGFILVGPRGGTRANPRARCINRLLRMALLTRKTLGLDAPLPPATV
jgi:hypothetical protein